MNKYAAAILSLLIVVVGAFSAIEAFTVEAIAQLVILAASSIVVYFVPLLEGAWKGAVKTGAALVMAGGVAIVPLVTASDYSPQSIALFVLALLNALAVELGVKLRTDERTARSTHVNR